MQGRTDTARAFISYASADREIANAVCAALERGGVRCWIAPRDVAPGEFYAADIVHAIDATELVVLILSRNAADSAHVQREVERASSRQHPVLTLRIDQAPLPAGLEYFLNTSQWLDASATGAHRALPRLVDAVKNALAKQAAPASNNQVGPVAARASWRPNRMVLILALLAAVALAYLTIDRMLLSKRAETREAPADQSIPAAEVEKAIAVLPFADMSPTRDQDYLADGIAEEILNLLSQSPALRVIARTSSFSFRDRNVDVATIASRLNVTHVLEGSVRKSGKRIRVTAQLVDAGTASHVWSKIYDRDESDFLDLQTEIARSVASALQIAFAADGDANRARSADAGAHELYLQGLYSWNRNEPGDLERARGYFERAVALDPSYSNAWAGMAGVYRVLIYDRLIEKNVGLAKQREAVQRALALAPGLAQSHIRASQYFWDIGDENSADRHFEQAVLLAPDDPQVLRISAGAALDAGNIDEAIELESRAIAVDPLSARSRTALAEFLIADGRWSEGKVQVSKALDLSPGSRDLNADLCRIAILQKELADAQSAARKVPEGPRRDQCLALVYVSSGKSSDADEAIARLISARKRDESGLVELYVGEVHAYRGAGDEAFEWLERASRQAAKGHGSEPGWAIRMQMRLSPFLKSLHADSRWKELVDRPAKS